MQVSGSVHTLDVASKAVRSLGGTGVRRWRTRRWKTKRLGLAIQRTKASFTKTT